MTSPAGWRAFAAVAVGGLLGTGLRLAADVTIPHAETGFPASTLAVNLIGSFVLAALVARVWTRPTTPAWLRAGLGAGLLGSFTTFSAVAVSVVAMTADSEWMLALLTVVASVVLGLAAAVLGLRTAGRRPPAPIGVDE